MPNKHINNADDITYNLIRNDNACAQMVTHIKEQPLKCCYFSEGIHPLVGIVKEIRRTSLEKKR